MAEAVRQLEDLIDAYAMRMITDKLSFYEPYPKQLAFHNARDASNDAAFVKALMAGNQIGKTFCAAMEVAWHLTGRYPDYYEGIRFDHPVVVQIGSNTNETNRDICQAELIGPPEDHEEWGTGTVPRDCLGQPTKKPGVPNALDSIQVKHVSGGWSIANFRAYEQGAKKHMGKRFHVGWTDEECPADIWSQYLRGILSTHGLLLLTFTPENGITQIVAQLINEIKKGQALVRAEWADAKHLMQNPDRLNELKAQFPEHELEMREKGIPMMGSGLVWPVSDADIAYDPFELPRHWPRICGIDFGYDHPFAAVWIAWDRESDIIYIYDVYKERKATPAIHVSAIRKKGQWIPVVWPHDGLNTEKSSAIPLANTYRKEGLNMMYKKFTNPPAPDEREGEGGNSIEYGVIEMLERMQQGRLKIARHLKDFWDEKALYHRKDGKIVARMDDVVSAARYACLSVRHATCQMRVVRNNRNRSRGVRNFGNG